MNILELRRRTLGKGVYKKTVEGNPAIAQGSLARRYPGITMQGWTEQDGTPTPEAPVPIVSAGKYDEASRKYQYTIKISDSEESPTKSQTVTLTSDRPLTKWDKLEKRNGQWGWTYKSGTMTLDGTQILGAYNKKNGFYFRKSYNWNIESKDAYSDKLININRKNISGIPYFDESFGNKNYCYVLSVSEIYGSTTGEIKQNLSQNPITFYYETAEETFTPLSESEQEQMNTLHTFRPTTVLSNDCGCNMTLTYKTKRSMQSAPGVGYPES